MTWIADKVRKRYYGWLHRQLQRSLREEGTLEVGSNTITFDGPAGTVTASASSGTAHFEAAGVSTTRRYESDGILKDGNGNNIRDLEKAMGFRPVHGPLEGDHKKMSGSATFSGDGGTTVFSVTHDLGTTPNEVLVTPTSAAADADHHVSAKAANTFDVTYASAPSSGTDNVTFDWWLFGDELPNGLTASGTVTNSYESVHRFVPHQRDLDEFTEARLYGEITADVSSAWQLEVQLFDETAGSGIATEQTADQSGHVVFGGNTEFLSGLTAGNLHVARWTVANGSGTTGDTYDALNAWVEYV